MKEKEIVLKNIGSGWHGLIETVYAILSQLSFCDGVEQVEQKNGMLTVRYVRSDLTTPEQEFILKAVEYKFERLTARICEECGLYGLRRTELSKTKTLCTSCYAHAYSELYPVPSMVANPEPHTDY